jgi:putative endonuclease
MVYTYILKSVNFPKTYVGSTIDLDRRLREHNSGFCTFSKRYKPWVLIYQEKFDNIDEARQREKYFKSAAGRSFIKKNIYIPR